MKRLQLFVRVLSDEVQHVSGERQTQRGHQEDTHYSTSNSPENQSSNASEMTRSS